MTTATSDSPAGTRSSRVAGTFSGVVGLATVASIALPLAGVASTWWLLVSPTLLTALLGIGGATRVDDQARGRTQVRPLP